MNGSEYDRLREIAWRRRLTASEQERLEAHLEEHPEAREDWDLEQRLGRAMRELSDAPLASNFTAQVLRAVEREHAAAAGSAASPGGRWWLSLNWARALAVAAVALCGALAVYQHSRTSARAELARSVANVSSLATLPSLEVLQDFEAINRLGQVSQGVDLDLLAAVQ